MANISFQVIDGIDKGRQFVDLETLISTGREEGNSIRLNDDRVSRFHAKIMEDQGKIVLTDLDSTNGTLVNGETIQLRLLRPGDRIEIGRSTIVFGTPEQIAQMLKLELSNSKVEVENASARTEAGASELLSGISRSNLGIFEREPPLLPMTLTPAQAAQLSEVLDFLHRALADTLDGVQFPHKQRETKLTQQTWQRLQSVLSSLARYSRQVAEPMNGSSNQK